MISFQSFCCLWTSILCACVVTSKETIVFVSDTINFTDRQRSIMSVTEMNPTTELMLSTHQVTIVDFIYIYALDSLKSGVPTNLPVTLCFMSQKDVVRITN